MTDNDQADRPLVTFIVVSFNQEQFIREAVEGALSQTYEPLEIILSDDCSTDSTFEIMCDIVSSYTGPHSVRLVRNQSNMGTFAHALARTHEALGEIVVGSGGDDISAPERTTRIVEEFNSDPEVGGVFSGAWIIDEDSKILGPVRFRTLADVWGEGVFLRNGRKNTVMRGSTAAYKKWVFDVPLSPTRNFHAEDIIFSFYLNLVGARIVYLKEPLVRYRTHIGAAGHNSNPDPAEHERRVFRAAPAMLNDHNELERIAIALGKEVALDKPELDRMRQFFQDILDWPELSFPQRLRRVLRFDYRGELKPELKRRIWRAARLWGVYPNYKPKVLVVKIRQFRSRLSNSGRCR